MSSEMYLVPAGIKNQNVRLSDENGDTAAITHQGYQITRASEDSMFNDIVMVERTNLIELKSNVNVISALRDVTTSTDGSVTATGGEYVIATTATANASAQLDSAEIGRYQPGFAAEAGIGVRCEDVTMTGEMEDRWGYYDDNNGFFFGRDATGTFVAYRRDAGDDVKIYQENWNGDNLDGNNTAANPSGQTFDVTNGNIYQIRFSWYGYGVIEWRVVTTEVDTGEQTVITVHRFNPTTQNSTTNPNLPLRAEVLNGATATAHTIYVGGRQFSILGRYNPRRRVTSDYRLAQGSVGTTFLPTVTFRRTTAGATTSVKLEGFDIITDQDLLVQVRIDGTLTGGSFGVPTDHSANETSTESNTGATAITGGEVVYETLISASGQGTNTKGSATRPLLPIDFPQAQNVTVCVRRLSGTGATVQTVMRVTEEW